MTQAVFLGGTKHGKLQQLKYGTPHVQASGEQYEKAMEIQHSDFDHKVAVYTFGSEWNAGRIIGTLLEMNFRGRALVFTNPSSERSVSFAGRFEEHPVNE